MKTLTDKLQYLYGQVNAAHREYIAEAMVEIERLNKWAERVRKFVESQAEDEGLWFEAKTISEVYLQHELRKLHTVIECNKGINAAGDYYNHNTSRARIIVRGGIK